MDIGSKLKTVRTKLNLTQEEFAEKLGVKQSQYSLIEKNKAGLPLPKLNILFTDYGISAEWFFSEDLNSEYINIYSKHVFDSSQEDKPSKRMIPLYDDMASPGGKTYDSQMKQSIPTEWIDTGDWFQEATAAIRYYGEDMVEYQSGCILAVKEVADKRIIFWGKNYVIETPNGRLTRRLQSGRDGFLKAYSSNIATYPDGRQVFEPIEIPMDAILRLFLVLGYVVKEYSSNAVFLNKNGLL